MDKGGPKPYRIQGNSEYYLIFLSRQTFRAKVESQKGNSPDRSLRSQRNYLVGKDVVKR